MNRKNWVRAVCQAMGTLIIAQDATGFNQVNNEVLSRFYSDETFFRTVQELIIENEGDDFASYQNAAMVVSLSHFCILTNRSDPTMVPLQQLQELRSRVTDDINVIQPLSVDILVSHKDEEEDLFFEVAIGDEACQALKQIGRRRFLSKWSDRELQVCKAVAQQLLGPQE